MLFVYPFLVLGLLLPLVDVALAGFQYISAWQALRAFGQSILYTPPPDVTNLSAGNWASTVQTKAAFNSRFPIGNLQVECGSSPCSADTATVMPKYYSYSTTVTLAPTVLKSVLCTSGAGDGCTFTLFYSERFQ
ncbi:MAG: hypothetical protein J0H17_05875 [Rhizobiales bacterium]|nr:hypothetical protein [Hyphomicrobiales bacterium]